MGMKIFRSAKEEQFKTYYQRKRNRKYSIFSSLKEALAFAIVMIGMSILPLLLIFANAEKPGFFWWILLLSYCAILAGLIFMIYRYREITQMRGNFSRKEFEKMFKKELWLVSIMDNLSRFLLH